MKRRCCCGCSVAWEDNFLTDKLSQYDKSGTWSRVSNKLRCGAAGSKIITPAEKVTFFVIDQSTGLGDYDEFKVYIRYVDANNHVYGRLKNNGPGSFFGGGTDTQVELHTVIAGVDTCVMRNSWIEQSSGPFNTFSGRWTISDRKGAISFTPGGSYNGLYSQQWGVIGYNYSGQNTCSIYLPGTPAKAGFEIVTMGNAYIDFDNLDVRKGTEDIEYGVDNDCRRLLSNCNMNWQEPEKYTCIAWQVDLTGFMTANNPDPGFGCSACEDNNPFEEPFLVRSWPIYSEYQAQLGNPANDRFDVEDPCWWTTWGDDIAMNEIICGSTLWGFVEIKQGYFDGQYRLGLFAVYAGDYVHYWSDPLPLDPDLEITFTRDPAWGGYDRCLHTWPDTCTAIVLE